jgi:hypothetical protein
MRLSEEQALQDNNRFANCNVLVELKYCGWEIPQRREITNDEIRFYAWLCRSAVSLLKEHEAVKPVLDEQTGRIWLCGNCGSYVGFEDHDEDDPNEFDKYCRECGRPVLWEGR